MSNVVIGVRQRARGNVTVAMILWSITMAVALFLFESRWTATASATWTAVAATVAFGVYLGWQRRTAAVLIAPIVSWFFAWPPLWAAAMVHDGFVRGLFVGLFLVTIGWIVIGFAEFLGLGAVALAMRWVRGSGPAAHDVIIFGPGD